MRQGSTRVGSRIVGTALALVALAGAAPAQDHDWSLPDERIGVRTAPMLLLTRPDVQEDLGLTPEVVLSHRRIVRDIWTRAATLRGKPDGEVLAARRGIDQEQTRWLQGNLTEAQRERLMQIDLQWEGLTATVSRPWVADWLELTPDQRARGKAVLESARTAAEARPEAPSAELAQVLTPDQVRRWQGLIGPPFQPRRAAAATAAAPAR
jgi:hypothetical protein